MARIVSFAIAGNTQKKIGAAELRAQWMLCEHERMASSRRICCNRTNPRLKWASAKLGDKAIVRKKALQLLPTVQRASPRSL